MSKIFPFFRLPRELRDRIYAEIGGRDVQLKFSDLARDIGDDSNGATPVEQNVYRATFLGAPKQTRMVLCRKFKLEYETELCRTAIFRVHGVSRSRVNDESPCHHLETSGQLSERLREIPEFQIIMDLSMSVPGTKRLPLPPSVPISTTPPTAFPSLLAALNRHMTSIRRVGKHTHVDARSLFAVEEVDSSGTILNAVKASIWNILGKQDTGSQGTIYRPRVFIHSPLVSMSKTYNFTHADRRRWPHLSRARWDILGRCLDDRFWNHITYEATLTDDEAAW